MTQHFTDEDLTAWLDGEANAELHAAIDTALTQDLNLMERAEELAFDRDTVRDAFDSVLAHAPAMPDLPEVPKAPRAMRGAFFGGGLAAGLAVALLVGVQSAPSPQPGRWIDFVASYQALYSTRTLAGVTLNETEGQAQLALVSQAIGRDLTNLPQIDGLTFKRAQILGFKGKPLIQIAFLRDDGTPVALCILPKPDAGDRTLKDMTLAGLSAAKWTADGHDFLLIGGDTADTISQEAQIFEAAL